MRSSHHSSAVSVSGNEADARFSTTSGASAMTSTLPTSRARRGGARGGRSPPSRLPIRLQSRITASTSPSRHVVDHGAVQTLGRPEEEVALQLEDGDAVAVPGQEVVLLRRANPVRTRLQRSGTSGGPRPAPRVGTATGAGRGRRRDAGTPCTPRALLPRGVERRREHADAELAGQHRDHAAGHAALRREPDRVRPLARVVVHAARAHHAQHVLDVRALERPRAGDRVDAAVGERRRHGREVAARHRAASTGGSRRR